MFELLAWIIAFIIAITFHEAAHAWMADRLGDPTARLMGRLSLNPLVHYDRVGTTLLLGLVVLRALGAPVIPFGWAKPVQFDPFNLKHPRRDSALIAVAGPISNLIIASLAALMLHITIQPFSLLNILVSVLVPIIYLNVILAVFNLLPIHPLDGGKIFVGLLPENEAGDADQFLHRYGMLILFFLIFPTLGGNSPLSFIISPIVNFVLTLLLPNSPII